MDFVGKTVKCPQCFLPFENAFNFDMSAFSDAVKLIDIVCLVEMLKYNMLTVVYLVNVMVLLIPFR